MNQFEQAAFYSVKVDGYCESGLVDLVTDPEEYKQAIEDLTEVHGTLPPMDYAKLCGVSKGDGHWLYSTLSGHLDAPIKER